ncbi:hypothetical protein MTR67_024132 [Solanum verrucosum]|uniref:Uncharacterized protein n=1 Tax=Solanum verrucosum TaxID=315347 RepID=A0AAF0QUT8_SOLVR|nr:hypothetical protein MTR67_024132 [Solanum verrucosum]
MQVTGNDEVELASYQLKDVAHIRFFPRELREPKAQNFMNLKQGSMLVQEYRLKFTQLSRQGQRYNNNKAQSTAPAAPACRLTHQGASSGTSSGQHQNKYSPDVVTVNFGVSPKTLSEPLSVSTPVGDSGTTRWIYRNCPITVSQKVTSKDLVELEMAASYFSKIDLRSVYRLLRVRDSDILKTTFRTWVFKQYLDLFVIVFINDILIYYQNEEEHATHLSVVLKTLKDRQLFAKFSKCELWLHSVVFLGLVVSIEGIRVVSQKIEAVKHCPKPTSLIDIRSFLGLMSEKSFSELKTRLTTTPVLTLPDGLDGYVTYGDASRVGLGCVLMQRDTSDGGVIVQNGSKSSLVAEVREKQQQKVEVFSWGRWKDVQAQKYRDN